MAPVARAVQLGEPSHPPPPPSQVELGPGPGKIFCTTEQINNNKDPVWNHCCPLPLHGSEVRPAILRAVAR